MKLKTRTINTKASLLQAIFFTENGCKTFSPGTLVPAYLGGGHFGEVKVQCGTDLYPDRRLRH